VFVKDKKTQNLHQENRILRLWFFKPNQDDSLRDGHEFIRTLFKSDEFPKDYFSFIKRLMELLRKYTKIRKIELEIQTITNQHVDIDNPRMSTFSFRFCFFLNDIFSS